MSDEKKQCDENWRDATADDVAEIMMTGKPKKARIRNENIEDWYNNLLAGWWLDSSVVRWIDLGGAYWTQCQVPVESAPTRSPKDGCRMLEDNEEPIPGDFINVGAGWEELGEGSFPLALIPSWFCRPIKEPISKSDRPVPKGFRLLGDEPRLASDGYWSLSCKDWIVIGDRIEEANRDKWPAIRLVVDEPEPVKHFVLANDQDNEQALYVNGKLEDIDHPIYGYNIAEAANGCTIRIESREVGKPDDEWPTKLSELIIVDKEQLENPSGEWEATKDKVEYAMDRCGVPASVFGSDPIEVRPIMQIRLPVPASVLGKLGDMLEKHYPGSTMRQVGGFLVFEEPIES